MPDDGGTKFATLARRAALTELGRPLAVGAKRRERLSTVPAAARPLFHELVAGIHRRRVVLDHVAAAYCQPRLDRLDKPLLDILRIGLYQLIYLDGTHPAAVVDETVALCPRRLGRRARGLVNGVMRSCVRGMAPGDPNHTPTATDLIVSDDKSLHFDRDIFTSGDPFALMAARCGFTTEAARMFAGGRDDDAVARVLTVSNRRPVTTLRPRTAEVDALTAELLESGIRTHSIDGGLLALDGGGDPAANAAFRAGRFVVQAPFAAKVGSFLGPSAGERILDLCAVPGGKSFHLADLEPSARIVAGSLDDDGLTRLREAGERLGLEDRVEPVRVNEIGSLPDGPFDAILLDVPCSNSGVLGRRPEARHRLFEKSLGALGEIQANLLDRALLASTAPAPCRIVYATCSVLARENRELIDRVLTRHAGFEVSSEISQEPDDAGFDGGYAAIITARP